MQVSCFDSPDPAVLRSRSSALWVKCQLEQWVQRTGAGCARVSVYHCIPITRLFTCTRSSTARQTDVHWITIIIKQSKETNTSSHQHNWLARSASWSDGTVTSTWAGSRSVSYYSWVSASMMHGEKPGILVATDDWRKSICFGCTTGDWRKSSCFGRTTDDWRKLSCSGRTTDDWRKLSCSGRTTDDYCSHKLLKLCF